ncbi:DNA-methyltransferase [Curtobacterium flaccumfaciens]|uniref:DNA-methyltransferase n=1 Tax=Curtobacterium flaccumfaciens TaxID=2035 RepID=UPI002657EABA|nr:site-specific DNA-methyltransferase [Curtobacterium flaccumfaciens]MCS5507141.1 site-specific DNA-methyltransferase [Curtobacterium flaccumfaciens pv. flaccumfaciens]
MTVHHHDDMVTLHHGHGHGHGHALAVAGELADGAVRTIVTSPPYFGLRDYGHDEQIGSEPTVAEYVDSLVALFRELRRVLADDGTLWLNLGDTYAAKARGSDAGWDKSRLSNPGSVQKRQAGSVRPLESRHRGMGAVIAEKNLVGIPWRVAFALQDDGWVLRSDIIWAKPNPMPESVTDRPTKAHEYLFLLSKGQRYFYDAASIADPIAASSRARLAQPKLTEQLGSTRANGGAKTNGAMNAVGPKFGGTKYGDSETVETRTKSGDEWTVPSGPFAGAHFAVFPPDLMRPCVRAGSRPGDVVLDSFSGSGTTRMVATQEGRRYVASTSTPISSTSAFAPGSRNQPLGWRWGRDRELQLPEEIANLVPEDARRRSDVLQKPSHACPDVVQERTRCGPWIAGEGPDSSESVGVHPADLDESVPRRFAGDE